jgi:hypothetical protein
MAASLSASGRPGLTMAGATIEAVTAGCPPRTAARGNAKGYARGVGCYQGECTKRLSYAALMVAGAHRYLGE